MSLLIALALIVHGGVHVGYACGQSWPFAASDPWLVTGFGAGPDTLRSVGIALVVVIFVAYLLAALAAAGILIPSTLFAPLIVIGSVASAMLLVAFVTPWTVPFLVIDALLLWATLIQNWRPAPFFGG